MKIGVEHYRREIDDYDPIRIYYNVPEDGSYLDFLVQMQIKSNDRVWVDKDKQLCIPCRLRKILTYQFGLEGVKIYEFDD